MNQDKRFSEKAFFEFIDFAGKKGLIKQSKANNWRASASQVLAILDPNEKNDLRGLNIDQLFERFANLKATAVTSGSLKVYKSRFRGAFANFISWAEDPTNYKPLGRSNTTKKANAAKKQKIVNVEQKSTTENNIESPINRTVKSDTFILPIPISGGRIITVTNLPYELSIDDAKRISAMIQALAINDKKTKD